MRASSFSVAVFAASVALVAGGCTPKREVRADGGADASLAHGSAPPLTDGGIADSGLVFGAKAADAGPPDDSLPPPGAPDLATRGRHLLEAITQDNPELGIDFLFPRDAYVAARDTADAAKLWEKRTLPAFQRDVHTLHQRLKGKEAQFVSLEVGQAIMRIVPKRHDFKKGLWRVKHSRLSFTIDGNPQRFEIGEMISWRGAWYVTKLR
jgi:hypothetical protein